MTPLKPPAVLYVETALDVSETRAPGGILVVLWRLALAKKSLLMAGCLLTVSLMCAVCPALIAPHDPLEQHRLSVLVPPAWASGGVASFPLGTDELGRDLLSRVVYGARISLLVSLVSVLLAMAPGILIGLLDAFFQRQVGYVISRAMDIMMALPAVLLAITILTILGPGLVNTMIAIGIGGLPGYARLTRAAALSELGKQYVTASRVAGSGTARLMFRAVLPNCMPVLIVNATLGFSSATLEVAALGFLGLGVQAPTPEWGTMLSSARDYMHVAPWVVAVPGVVLLCFVLSINLIGDALRDVLDPKRRSYA